VQKHFGKVDVGPYILSNVVTDARFLRARGIACYGFWPYRVDYYQSRGIHGTDERLRVDWFIDGVQLMKRIVAAYAR
jgi:acetylornithine deacetylase/succinyl-diaminopimelate desuccinylase-like protein